MKFIRKFETESAYNNLQLDHTNTPNISLVSELQSLNSGIVTTPMIEQAPSHDYSLDYLTFVAIDDCYFEFDTGDCVIDPGTISYSLDNGTTWSEFFATKTEAGIREEPANGSIYVTSGNKVLFKGNNFNGCALNCTPAPIFAISKDVNTQSQQRFNIEGNIMSLIYGDNFVGQTQLPNYITHAVSEDGKNVYDYSSGVLQAIFMGNTSLINAENLILPLTTIPNNCYSEMFSGCTSLITAPKLLPATTLAENCYGSMFYDCTSLVTSPKLPATELAQWCYSHMFEGCTNLKNIVCYAKNLEFNDIYSETYTGDWVKGVNTKNGSFVKDSSSIWPTTWPENEYGNFSGIPVGWTIKNK